MQARVFHRFTFEGANGQAWACIQDVLHFSFNPATPDVPGKITRCTGSCYELKLFAGDRPNGVPSRTQPLGVSGDSIELSDAAWAILEPAFTRRLDELALAQARKK